MRVYELVWSSMMYCECIWKRMNVYELIWWYMKVYDSIWVKNGGWRSYMKVYEVIL